MMTPKKEFDPSVHGLRPKVIAMRDILMIRAGEPFHHHRDGSQRKARSESADQLPDKQKDEARALRCKLLAYRFAHRLSVAVDESLYDDSLTPVPTRSRCRSSRSSTTRSSAR